MPSTIDPTKPLDGVPAIKADLRANLQAAKTELDHGGFVEGFNPVNYGPPASTAVADHLAAVDAALAALGPGFEGTISVKDPVFGAIGDGVADDTAPIQNALNSTATIIFLPRGTYRITAPLSVPPGNALVGAGTATIIDAAGLPDQLDPGAVHCYGTVTLLPTLASSIDEGDEKFTFSSGIDGLVQHGDAVVFKDDRDQSFMAQGAQRDGFTAICLERDGTIFYPTSFAKRTLPSPRIGGGTVGDLEIGVLDRRGVTLRNFTLRGRGWGHQIGTSSGEGIGISLRYLANVRVDGVEALAFPTVGLELDRCSRFSVTNSRFSGHAGNWTNASARFGAFCGGSSYGSFTNCVFQATRHAIDFGVGGGESPLRQFPCNDIVLDSCTLEVPSENAWMAPDSVVTWACSFHEGAYDVIISNNQINGGVSLRGYGHKLVGNVIRMGAHLANLPPIIGDHLGPRFGCVIRGNAIRSRTTNTVIKLDFDRVDTGAYNDGLLQISDNVISVPAGTTLEIIEITGSPGAQSSAIIANNIVQSTNSQPFLDILSSIDEVFVHGNKLASSMSIGTLTGPNVWRGVDNMIGGNVIHHNLPTSSSGLPSGAIWQNGSTLAIVP